MQRLLANYEPSDELEVRYYIDPRARHPAECIPAKHPAGFRPTLEKILERLGGQAKARHTRIIDLQLGELRKRIEFNATGERREIWCEKKRRGDWVEPNDFGGMRVALARETPVAPRKMETVERITVKYRFTFALDCLGLPSTMTDAQRLGTEAIDSPWLIDVSAVKVCDLPNIQDAKAKLLACCDPLELWPWWDHWEFERELNPQNGHSALSAEDAVSMLELDDLYQSYSIFAPLVDHEMLDAVRRVAIMIEHPKAGSFQRLSPRNTITRLLPKAVEPTLEAWIENHAHRLQGMVLRDKIDGTRELVWIRDGTLICVGAKAIDEWPEEAAEGTFVFDCEFHNDVWYVLHALVWRGRCVTGLRDTERLALVTDTKTGVAALKVPGLAVCPARVVERGEDVLAWWRRRPAYHRDGLIISTDEAYFKQDSLKWKPAEESTVDQLIVQCPDWLIGKAPYIRVNEGDTLYILNVGVSAAHLIKHPGFPLKRYLDIFHLDKTALYVPQPFSPPDLPAAHVWSTDRPDLHGYIGEFIYIAPQPRTAVGGHWELRRLREDKPSLLRNGTEIGNDTKTAMDIWSKIANPFPLEYIWSPPAQRASRFDALHAPVMRVVADLLGDEMVSNALVHMCPFIPFESQNTAGAAFVPVRGALMPARPTDTLAAYRPDLSNNSRVVQVLYDQIGRIELPKDFIGGAQLLVTMDPELLGHVSCLAKSVAAGGRMVVICRPGAGDDSHPEVGRAALMKDMDRAGFALMQDHGAPETDAWDISEDWSKFAILSFRKENRGASDMKPEEVRKENPHIADNLEANFSYKFSRQKTKDIAGLLGADEDCESLQVDPMKGELLVDIEFLSTLLPDAQVLYAHDLVEAARVEHLRRLFPAMHFRTRDGAVEPTADNVEAVVSHTAYASAMELIKEFEPHCGMLDFSHEDLTHKVLKGRVMLYPYAELTSTRIALVYGRDRQEWNILPDIFQQEMMTFHRCFRPTAFKYAAKSKAVALDNCFDCRTSIYIMTKYAKVQKITLDEAYARLG
jgi:hypothetical protein